METYSIYNISKGERKKTKMKGKKFLAFSLTVAMLAGSALTVSAAGVADVFDAGYYADKYGDLKTAYGADEAALLKHFMTNGAKEGRVMNPILDVAAYRKAYADLNATFGDDWDAYVDHYLTYGIKEKRTAGVLFELADYAAKNPDVKETYGDDYTEIAKHYLNFGIKEGRLGGTIVEAAPTAPAASGSGSGSSTTKPEEKPVTTVETHEHVWVEVGRKAGTCTEDGYIDYTCTVPKMYQVKDDKGNLISTELVIGADGNPIFCDAKKREVTGKGHVPPTDANGNKVNYYCVPATCLSAGVEKYTCARCGEHVDNILPKLEHVFENDYVVDPHGCTPELAGYTVQKCFAGCGQTRKVDYTYLDHQVATYDLDKKEATCSSMGEAWGICSVCAAKVKQTIPMKEHEFTKLVTVYVDSYTQDKAAPCHDEVELTVCKNCSMIRKDPTGVNVKAQFTPCVDTAENGGKGDGYCDVCLRSMKRNHTNQVMQYIPGDTLDDKKGQ